MAAPRKRTGLVRRRRRDDESDDMSVATDVADDSQSDVSVPSDIDEDADADNSDLSETDSPSSPEQRKRKSKGATSPPTAKPRADVAVRQEPSPPIARSDAAFPVSEVTKLMRNGLSMSDAAAGQEEVDFETGDAVVESAPAAGKPETLAEKRRREHEEYKKKRDADPTFIPNRGNFFMHDQRSPGGANGLRQFGPRGGRGGRGGFVGRPSSPANPPAATDSQWRHDLHETLSEPAPRVPPQGPARTSGPADPSSGAASQAQQFQPSGTAIQGPHSYHAQHQTPPSQPRNFSTTVHTHNANVRVFIPGMKAPIHFTAVPIKQHTRLPNHRPPLRRDKPVRVSLPPAPPRYIFPTQERSFIFIPRALRPNQQGFGRGRGRGFGSFGGGFSSRRTSVYGGSVYSPSIAMSRRSSIVRDMGRDGMVSPAGSVMSRSGIVDPTRPVVRLPPGPRVPNMPPNMSPQVGAPTAHQSYPLPQPPTFRENWQGQIPMHHPLPQKTVSVAGIESPASMTFNVPKHEHQPFHQQIPAHMNGTSAAMEQQAPVQQHMRQLSYSSQPPNGTPLSNIPERAIHAPAFQPYQAQAYPPAYPMAPGYYYPPNGAQPYAPVSGMMPMYVPNAPQAGYMMPVAVLPGPPAPVAPAPGPSAQPGQPDQAGQPVQPGQPNLVAYEANGVTYYVDQAQLYPPAQMEGYGQPSYAVPGMGGMMTPSPEGAGYYYPQQMPQPMQPNAPMYYPQQ
ncbi:hypothetical protein M011DRAFT_164645 [Sporormia fimetaria CBS 119925]|uniref:Btz domain-containing protein n=1 Tax=Sporormia fimetaria CBS 119925 TaxID=1340428 RepID=A0A6A6V666_9PLEO|nr:hypothetical protein M011DRAFT_164645 [Sporormia fimetaria CBS 119925]